MVCEQFGPGRWMVRAIHGTGPYLRAGWPSRTARRKEKSQDTSEMRNARLRLTAGGGRRPRRPWKRVLRGESVSEVGHDHYAHALSRQTRFAVG
ncbi:hypothetical protein GCM10022245_24580 [Streptomyces mayteni]